MVSIIGAVLTSCGEAMEWNDSTSSGTADVQRQLVMHEVTVSIDDAATRVAYTPDNNIPAQNDPSIKTPGLKLSWEADELLSVYIKKTDNSIVYAGQVASHGSTSDSKRRFTGEIKAKDGGESYVYVHPALFELDQEVRPNNYNGYQPIGKIDYTNQSGALGSTAHLTHYIPLVWEESSLNKPTNNGYALHLNLKFNEDPGTIRKVTLQTMPGAGTTNIFPASFDARTMAAANASTEVTLNVTSGTATQGDDGLWTADAYIASSNITADVFRTKFNVKVEAEKGTYYNEFRSFAGQESATDKTLAMLANGQCYNLTASMMSKDVAPTIVSSTYKVNSLLGMWDTYGKVTDPFGLVKTTGLPSQLSDLIGTSDKQTAFTDRMLVDASSQGTPTFTWTMVTNQCGGSYKQADVTYNNIEIVGESTEVYVTFLSEYAWAQNLLGYYHYPKDNVPTSSSDVLKTIIFPNVSKGGHVPYNKDGVDGGANVNPNTDAANVGVAEKAPLQEYTTVQLLYNNPDGSFSKVFPVGTTIGFFIMRDPQASSSGHDEGSMGDTSDDTHAGYSPRPDNTLLDWNSWRLFTNTAWNSASGNIGWWNTMSCQNFFCSANVGDATNGGVIQGLALYGAKDDASHNYNYSFSAMLYMVSTSNQSSMRTANKCYFNLGTGNQIINK